MISLLLISIPVGYLGALMVSAGNALGPVPEKASKNSAFV